MLSLRVTGYWAVLILLMSCTDGCFQANSHPDEEMDAHFQKGRTLADSQDFKDAAQEFEKALDDNPRSAAAHFELGWLYDTKLNDYAAAIYHYDRHLQYLPGSKRAEMVRERIRGCKQELANSEFPLPNTRNLQKDVDRLNAENALLKKELLALTNQLEAEVALVRSRPEPVALAAIAQPDAPRSSAAPASAGRPHVHIVKPHETFSSIAAEYGMRTSAILAANPQTNPKHLRVGQSLNLP